MLIQRKEYLNKLIAFRDKQLIKIVTGIRRCGKSTLLELYQEYLRENGVSDTQIISINFEDMDYEELTDCRKLHAFLKSRLIKDKMTYIFLTKYIISMISRRWWTASISGKMWTSISRAPMRTCCPVRSPH